ncbi:duf302 domain-containing protein [Anaeramoeba ignava]|uniref:Duf302 domain-containing protein n=1 Tax=Anaeramoeba ignava TaxID=1746090 RepID=A0A9Q0L5V1_ANAIG|nr:duf302 domain-containing protein [Anaeramoeba ignava]
MTFVLKKKLKETDFEKALETVIEALKSCDLIVLAQARICKSVKAALNEDFGDCLVITFCYPEYAAGFLRADPDSLALLPCHAALRKDKGSDEIFLLFPDPIKYFGIANNSKMNGVAEVVLKKLNDVFDKL